MAKQFVLTVVVEAYDRYENNVPKTIVYRGKDELTVLKKIIDVHGYGCDDEEWDDEELALVPKKAQTAKQLWKKLMDENGDGTDTILAVFHGEPILYKGPRRPTKR